MLSLDGCRLRMQRLQKRLEAAELDAAVITSARLVYYFSGALVNAQWPQAFVLTASGKSGLFSNQHPQQSAADELRLYTGYTLERPFSRFTMQQELNFAVSDFVRSGRIGVEAESLPASLAAVLDASLEDLTPWLMQARRRKDPDELACMRAVTALAERGYAAVHGNLTPGMTEVDAFSMIQEAINSAAGTSVELKGDFACGTRALKEGGSPTTRRVADGDLFILDLFPSHQGYMSDLCRTFCVGMPTAEQEAAWAHVRDAHAIAACMIRPGYSTRELYRELLAHLDRFPSTRGSFTHHAGHGVGMEGWEQPWLNPGSDQVFVEGEVIACEPALYGEHLHGGIRLEHNYLVTASGPEALDSFPFDL